jgi:hypothetical protein
MPRDQEESNRFLGMPLRTDRQVRQRPESQRVLGFPVDWFAGIDLDWISSLAHPVRSYRQWQRRRRLGPYLTEEDEPRR